MQQYIMLQMKRKRDFLVGNLCGTQLKTSFISVSKDGSAAFTCCQRRNCDKRLHYNGMQDTTKQIFVSSVVSHIAIVGLIFDNRSHDRRRPGFRSQTFLFDISIYKYISNLPILGRRSIS